MFDGRNLAQIDHISFKSLCFCSLPLAMPEICLRICLHPQAIPASPTSAHLCSPPSSDCGVIDGLSFIIGPHVLVAHQTQTMRQRIRRRPSSYPPFFDIFKPKEKNYFCSINSIKTPYADFG